VNGRNGFPRLIGRFKAQPRDKDQILLRTSVVAQILDGLDIVSLIVVRDLITEVRRDIERRVVIVPQTSAMNGRDNSTT
jgi:hypothetical protein